MPQIVVEHSANLTGHFDARALALAIHDEAVATIDATIESCKTRIVVHGQTVIGGGDPANAMLHIDFRGLPGRSEAAWATLGANILALASDAVKPRDGRTQVTVEIGELSRHYHKRTL